MRGRLHCGEERIGIKSERGGNHKLNTVRGIGATPTPHERRESGQEQPVAIYKHASRQPQIPMGLADP